MSQTLADRLAAFTSLLIVLLVTFGSLIPGSSLPDAPGSDKLHHFVAYAAIVFPVCVVRPRAALWMVPLAVAYGGMIEAIQPTFGRTADLGDVVANTTGALIGAAAAWAAHRPLARLVLRRA